MSETINCHYVSRFLMRPWSLGKGKRHRIACYYDVETDSIQSADIEKLFVQSHLNSPAVEAYLNKHIENPISQYRQALVNDRSFQFTDMALVRALSLFFGLQSLRYGKAKRYLQSEELDHAVQILEKNDESAIDRWAVQSSNDNTLLVLHLMSHDHLFYPESGIFCIPAPTSTAWVNTDVGWAFPIAPRTLVLQLPKGSDLQRLKIMPLSAYSTGAHRGCNKYIIPPFVIKNVPQGELILEFKRLRQVAEDAFTSIQLLSELQGFMEKSLRLIPHTVEFQKWAEQNDPKFMAIQKRAEQFAQSEWGKKVAKMIAGREKLSDNH